jgi:hypothetical protein
VSSLLRPNRRALNCVAYAKMPAHYPSALQYLYSLKFGKLQMLPQLSSRKRKPPQNHHPSASPRLRDLSTVLLIFCASSLPSFIEHQLTRHLEPPPEAAVLARPTPPAAESHPLAALTSKRSKGKASDERPVPAASAAAVVSRARRLAHIAAARLPRCR